MGKNQEKEVNQEEIYDLLETRIEELKDIKYDAIHISHDLLRILLKVLNKQEIGSSIALADLKQPLLESEYKDRFESALNIACKLNFCIKFDITLKEQHNSSQ